jgi:hypothetical protein
MLTEKDGLKNCHKIYMPILWRSEDGMDHECDKK